MTDLRRKSLNLTGRRQLACTNKHTDTRARTHTGTQTRMLSHREAELKSLLLFYRVRREHTHAHTHVTHNNISEHSRNQIQKAVLCLNFSLFPPSSPFFPFSSERQSRECHLEISKLRNDTKNKCSCKGDMTYRLLTQKIYKHTSGCLTYCSFIVCVCMSS